MVFYVNKCKIRVDYSFLLTLSFASLLKTESLLYVLLFSALHEAGHLIVLHICKGKPDSLTFSFYGIGMKHSAKLSKVEEIAFLSGGVAINLVFVLFNIQREINLLLLIVNILPLYPLDGGRIVKLLFGVNERYFKYFTYSFSALLLVYSVCIMNISMTLISAYVLIFALGEDLR